MWFDGTNRYVRMSALWLPRWANMCLPRDGKTCGFAVDKMARNDEAESRILAVFLIISDRARERLGLRDQAGQLSIQ